jgi:hypothetical protein
MTWLQFNQSFGTSVIVYGSCKTDGLRQTSRWKLLSVRLGSLMSGAAGY